MYDGFGGGTSLAPTTYVDQSAKDLQFYLVDGSADVEQFSVLTAADFVWCGHKIEIGVLGASHFMKVATPGGSTYTELFACAQLTTPLPLLRAGPLGRLQGAVNAVVDGLAYSFTPRLVSWKHGRSRLQALRERVTVASSRFGQYGLEFIFPSDNPSDPRLPLTAMAATATAGELSLATVHCYPNEDSLVFSETNLKRKES